LSVVASFIVLLVEDVDTALFTGIKEEGTDAEMEEADDDLILPTQKLNLVMSLEEVHLTFCDNDDDNNKDHVVDFSTLQSSAIIIAGGSSSTSSRRRRSCSSSCSSSSSGRQ
jgi:3-isopropylmalate dehydratase small subunit